MTNATVEGSRPVEVCITIDVEFSIAGAFAHPDRYAPLGREVVDCVVDGRANGLGFLLETFAAFGIKATFFVEAMNTAYFGAEPMGSVAREIDRAGHDVQLHLHPCWRTFADPSWRSRVAGPPPGDSCGACSEDELCAMLEHGIAMFRQWGLRRPVALRVGNFDTSRRVNRAMRRCGFVVGSNVCVGVKRPEEAELAKSGGRVLLDDTLELPVFCFGAAGPTGGRVDRPLAVTAASWPETRHVLMALRTSTASPVVVLTHPFEFIKKSDIRYGRMTRNRINQGRLRRLCEFIAGSSGSFVAATIGDRHRDWRAAPSAAAPAVAVPAITSWLRSGTNFLNDRIWAL